MAHLRISLLGRLQVVLHDQPISDFRTQKVLALLAYLADEPQTAHRRETLMTLLWPGMPDSSARSNLRQILFHLRQAIPDFGEGETAVPLLISNRHTLQLNPAAPVLIDTVQFRSLLQQTQHHDHLDLLTCQPCRADLVTAVTLYTGNFLSDFYLDDSNEFEEWAAIRRQTYQRKTLDALETLTTSAIRQQAYADGRSYVERQLEIDDLRENAYQQLMEIMARSGQRNEALTVYEKCRRLLQEELGMAPAARTTHLYEQILAGDLQLDTSPEQGVRGYDLKDEIGAGAYGVIHRAIQPGIGREVAVKIIRRRYANDPSFIRRFEAEAQTIAQLEHPHIVPLYDYWRDPDGAYLVMRLLRGGNLLTALAQGSWSLERTQKLLAQIAPALATAHQQGIVHRDIKPANILFDESDNAYLSDFGIAKDLRSEAQFTLDGGILGTPDYISPEQLLDAPVSAQSDIYSMGAVLYEMLTGEKPFPDVPLMTVIQSHLNAPFPLVSDSRPDLALSVDAVIQRATAKQPADRYPDALALADAFQQATNGRSATPLTLSPTIIEIDAPNPYKGLRAFQEADALDFYGRDQLTNQLVAHLHDSRFLAVVGASGSGKSSVVKAGLIPALRQEALPGSGKWFVAEMVPGTHPLEELELALWPIAVDPPPSLVEPMQRDPRGLLRTIRRILPNEDGAQLLLVIDQFEELWSLTNEERRRHFLDSLVAALSSPRTPLRVVVTLRADFYDRPLQYQPIAELFKQHTELVLPLSRDELTWVIQEPARRVGISFADGVLPAIVADVADQPGALPLLQYALTELFDGRSQNQITRQKYDEIGGVLGALSRRADEIYASLNPSTQQATRQLFLRLLTLGEGIEDTRRRVLRSELEGMVLAAQTSEVFETSEVLDTSDIINQFGAARLLTFDHDSLTRQPTVEVAHEALLREWGRLRRWLDESRDDVRLQRLLATAVTEWQIANQEPGYLLQGARLSQYEGWAVETTVALTHDEQAYLAASSAAQQQQQAAEEARHQRELATAQQLAETERERAEDQAQATQRLRRRAYYLWGAVVVAVVLAVAALVAGRQASLNATVAEQNAAEAQSVALASGAQAALIAGDGDRALTLAIAANEGDNPSAFAEQVLYEAALTPGTIRQFVGGSSWRWSLDVHPDGQMIASGDDNGEVTLWNLDSGEEVRRLTGVHTEPIGDVGFSPDGRFLLSGAYDDWLVLWDVATGEVVWQSLNPTGDVNVLEIAPNGRWAAAGTEGGVVTLWDMVTGEQVGELAGHDPAFQVLPVTFSPDGKLLASGSEDGSVMVWDVASQTEVQTIQTIDQRAQSLGNVVFTLAFSPDGQTLATGGMDNLVQLWDVASWERVGALAGHTDWVFATAFSPNGSQLLSTSRDGSLKVWDVAEQRPLQTLYSEGARILSVATVAETTAVAGASNGNVRYFDLADGRLQQSYAVDDTLVDASISADGRLALAGLFGEAQLLDLQTGDVVAHLPLPENEITAVAIDPFSQQFLTGTNDGTIVLWDADGQKVRHFEGHNQRILNLAFSPDGQSFLSGSDDKQVILWDVATGEPLFQTANETDSFNALAFSPDSRLFAAGLGAARYTVLTSGEYLDNSIRVWETETGKEIAHLEGHEGPTMALAFAADGRTLLSGSLDNSVRLWDVEGGKQLHRFDGHTGGVMAVAFSENGRYAASGAQDGTVNIWEIESGELLRQLQEHEGIAHTVAFMDETVWSAAEDGRFLLWNLALNADDLRSWTLDNRFIPELTCDQRALYSIGPLCGAP